MNYNFINKINGWVVFTIATIVYMLTIEDTASLWDCGEYITAAYKLEVGHPPGAPLFMILGRVFSFLPLQKMWRFTLILFQHCRALLPYYSCFGQ